MQRSLIIQNLEVKSREKIILKSFSYSFTEGKRYAITGVSGSGKTTLLRAIAGILDDSLCKTGDIIFPLIRNTPKERYIFLALQDQYASFSPVRRIKNEIKLFLKLQGIKYRKKERDLKIEEAGEWAGLEKEDLKRYPTELSGGMLERALLMKAYLSKAKILLFDESTVSLDEESELDILKKLKELSVLKSLTLLFVTHSKRVIENISDETIQIDL